MRNKVINWAADKGILAPEGKYKQALKLVEEVGELSGAILKDNEPEQLDALGDIQVVLIILAEQLGYDLDYCLEVAYNVIENRKGKTVDGVFIKED